MGSFQVDRRLVPSMRRGGATTAGGRARDVFVFPDLNSEICEQLIQHVRQGRTAYARFCWGGSAGAMSLADRRRNDILGVAAIPCVQRRLQLLYAETIIVPGD